MTFEISDDHNDYRLMGTVAFADVGVQNSRIRLYGTTQPPKGADPGGAPIAELLLAKPCGSVVAHVLGLIQADPTGDLALTTGSVVWGRWINGDDTLVADGTVSDELGTGDIKLSGAVGTLLYAGSRALLGTVALG